MCETAIYQKILLSYNSSIHLPAGFSKGKIQMTSHDLALLIPSRPASIADDFFEFQRRHGSVLWWSRSRIARSFKAPITGYIYQAGRIRYQLKVTEILNKAPEWAESAVPEEYRARLKSELKEAHSFLKIGAFERLEHTLSLNDFITGSGKELRAAPRRTIYVLRKN
jgi:hypothetical protein